MPKDLQESVVKTINMDSELEFIPYDSNINLASYRDIMMISIDRDSDLRFFKLCGIWAHISSETGKCTKNPSGLYTLNYN